MTLQIMRTLGADLLDFVFPPQCLACGETLEENKEYLCPPCWKQVLSRSTRGCRRCSNPHVGEVEECDNCASWDPAFERVLVLGDFGETLQQAVHALKFRQQTRLGVELGRCMGGFSLFSDLFRQIDVFVPVPLHGARQRERGYNQSECIARGLAEVLGKPLHLDWLKRSVNTKQQAKLDARGRRENLRDAFLTRGEIPSHQCLGLVDDVVTTGATVDACALALKQAGAGQIWVVALASPFPIT